MFEHSFKIADKVEIEVHNLADRPEFVPLLSQVCWNEWAECVAKDFNIHR